MAPIRRYLRITKHSVLEVRVYLDNPAHAESWLLRRNDPALPRVIEAVRPLVLPKLREENERASGKKGKAKKGVKDIVIADDFEVSIFLTELSTRHSILTKQKTFQDKPRMQSNSSKLTKWLTSGTSEHPHEVLEGGDDEEAPAVRQEEEEDKEPIVLDDIPEAAPPSRRRQKRHRQDSEEDLFVGDSDGEKSADEDAADDTAQDADDKKKLSLNLAYDGFSIYGRILCLVVKRKGVSKTGASGGTAPASSQQMLENWVSTQAAQEAGVDDEVEDG